MQYLRGIDYDFDSWQNEFGAKNWSYANVLKYFMRSENQTDKEILSLKPFYHSKDGPLTVSSTNR